MKDIYLKLNATPQRLVIPNVGTLALLAGLCPAPARTDWVGVQTGDVAQGNTYQLHIDVNTMMSSVTPGAAVAKVALASISNKSVATNAAWRILAPILQFNKPTAGHITVNVPITIHDNDGYLEAVSVSVQALGEQPSICPPCSCP